MTQQNDRSSPAGGPSHTHGSGSGSDTVSAAKNPTSPVGQSPKPGEGSQGGGSHGSGSDTASAAGLSSGGRLGTSSGGAPGGGSAGQSHAPQSSTLASHTSRPLGGSAGGTGAGTAGGTGGGTGGLGAGSSASSTASSGHPTSLSHATGSSQATGQGARGAAQSAADTARQAADQVQQQARDAYEQASSWASDQYENASRSFDHASRRSLQEVGRARHGVERFIQENPVLVGVMGLAAGLVVGALLPRTRHEDRAFGHWADEVREQGVRYARDMTQRGREYVDEAFSGDDARFATHDNERRGENRGGPRPGGGVGGQQTR